MKINHISREKIIIFDTNVYLDLYEYDYNMICKILNELKGINNLYITDIIYEEFMDDYKDVRHRMRSYGKRCLNNLKNSLKNLNFSRVELDKDIQLSAYSDKIENLIKEYTQKRDIIFNQIEEYCDSLKLGLLEDDNKDIILQFVNELHNNHQISNISYYDRIKLIPEIDVRYKSHIAPGFTDAAKEGDIDIPDSTSITKHKYLRKYDDCFIWFDILNLKDKDVCFVENELKEDWWKDSEKKIVSECLINEFEAKCPKCNFEMFDFYDFFRLHFRNTYNSFTNDEKFIFNGHKINNRNFIFNCSDDEILELLDFPAEYDFAYWLNEEWDRTLLLGDGYNTFANKIYSYENVFLNIVIDKVFINYYKPKIKTTCDFVSFVDARLETDNPAYKEKCNEYGEFYSYVKMIGKFEAEYEYDIINCDYEVVFMSSSVESFELTDNGGEKLVLSEK